ncbi:MAG: hypothetical protein C0478_16825, partial [Planctomyces sp.]|nr:hypothetical protein [Planctomyces sp.]
MIRIIPWVLIFTLGILLWAASPAAQADDTGLRRIDVPADQPDQWPKGVWSAVPREEFTRWMEIIASRKSQPTRSRLSRADYEFRIVDGRLEGSFEITLSGNTPEKGELVDLTPVTLPLKRLQWKSGDPAVFGLAADQRQYLWVDGQKRVDEDRLVGECVLTGAALPQSMFFNLSLFPADLSELRLKVPEGYQLSSSAGVIVRGPDAANGQQTVSSIRLAGTSECEVSLTRAIEKRDSTERLLYEEDLAAIIREDELRFLTTLIVEVPEQRTVEKLRFALPDNFELISATLGADTPLKFSRDSASKDIAPNTGSGIVISLPSPMTGRLRAIRLEGTQPGTALPQVTIPQIDLQDATLLRGRTTITVVSPLQMRGVEQEGYRESGPLTMTADGEVFTFDRQQARARLKLEIRRPIPRFTASSTTLVHGEVDHWRIRSHIDWFVSSGSLQQTTITIPPEWQVTQVLGDDEGSRLADWEVQRDGTRASLLQIEFALPGIPGQPRRVSISASRSFATTPKRLPIPSLKPTNAESTEYLIGIRAESAGRPTPAANSRFETTTLPATPDPRILRDVRQLSISLTPQDFLWFRANDPQTAGDIEFRSHLTPLDVTATVLARTHDSPLLEHYVIDVEADGSTPKELLVFITEPGDDIPWSAIHSGTNKPLAAQRAPRALYAEWGYPETGELWQISLGGAAGRKVRIQGSRQRPLEDAVIGLAFVPHASRFRGRVALAWPNDGTMKVNTTLSDPWETPDADLLALFDAEAGDSPAADTTPLAATGTAGSPEASVSLMKQQFWEYRGLDSQLSLTTLNKSENPSEQPPAQLHISAQIPATLGGECRYHFEYRLPSNRQASLAGLRLPDGLTLRSLRCDGQVIPSEILSSGASSERDAILWNRLEMDFSGPLESRWLHQTVPLAIPQVPVTILWATLTLQVPSQVEVADVSPPWYASQFAPPGWSERWFGPLSRSDSQPIFDPMGRAISWMISGDQAAVMTMPNTTRAKPNSRDQRWKTLTFSSPSQNQWSTVNLKTRGNERGRNNLPTMENSSALGEINISFWNMTELRRTCWVLLLGTVLGGVFCISLAPQRAVFALFLSGVVLAVGNPWLGMFAQPLAGSVLSGILLLLVIPPRWWQYRDSPAVKNAIPTGSTQSYRLPAGAMGILPSLAMLWRIGFVVTLVACALIGSPVAAQISPSSNPTGSTGNQPPVDNGNTLKPTIPSGTEAGREDGAPGNDGAHRDLLVPVDRDGQPSRTLPLVYLHPRTAAMLKASATDTPARIDSLVSRSRIVGQSNPNSIGALRATYDTWVLPGQDSPQLKLPMSGRYLGGRNSATVDGQSATLLPSTTGGEGLSIPLPSHAGGSNPALHEVALELRAARREVHGDTLFVLPLIPTLLAELNWQTGSSDDSPIIVSPQVAQPSPDDRAASIWLGPTDHLWLKAPGNPGVELATSHRPASEGASKLESVDMRAMMSVDHVSISHHSRLWRRADAGTLTMPIPADAVIRSIRADRMLNWYRKAGIDHDTLTIEFKGAS